MGVVLENAGCEMQHNAERCMNGSPLRHVKRLKKPHFAYEMRLFHCWCQGLGQGLVLRSGGVGDQQLEGKVPDVAVSFVGYVAVLKDLIKCCFQDFYVPLAVLNNCLDIALS